jgi:hypothetical protein
MNQGGVEREAFILGESQFPLLVPPFLRGVRRVMQDVNSTNSTRNQPIMTTLFQRINPAQKFRITKRQIAKFLRIPESQIVKIESWLYVVFVHRLDKGGQFISYRQMKQWKNAVAYQLQKCTTQQQLQHLWNAIEYDHTKHNKQYTDSVLPFLKKIWAKCQETSPKVPEIFTRADSALA